MKGKLGSIEKKGNQDAVMGNENGEWIMHGVKKTDPNRIKTPAELAAFIRKVGFLPLFKNEIPGFSVEEHTYAPYWWCGNPSVDPWEWRKTIAAEHKIAYGKFFQKKAGFISAEYLPSFINYRRQGYDFDALWDDEKASRRQKKIMDFFDDTTEIFSNELKEKAGFKAGGERNFDGTLTDLQMELYLCAWDFVQRKNKKGEPYGWPVTVLSKPEHIFGYERVTREYKETPETSLQKLLSKLKKEFPESTEDTRKAIIG